ncbi:hypothetical protein [Herbaspirillum sp.]|jgi:hypothetical protein|uniref:hypothetical protein n=1 Tax=Herbaspirillum sp. TaxID=1890675 RepID=UPI00258CF1C9|nr:hypothetical protein [Herbaspirillum sp.]
MNASGLICSADECQRAKDPSPSLLRPIPCTSKVNTAALLLFFALAHFLLAEKCCSGAAPPHPAVAALQQILYHAHLRRLSAIEGSCTLMTGSAYPPAWPLT